MGAGPRLAVQPASAPLDRPVDIRVTGCAPRQTVTLRARVDDARRGAWSAEAVFEADAAGAVDVSTSAPTAGSYATVDPLGLFWSLALEPSKPPPSAGFGALAEPVRVALTAETAGVVVGHASVERCFMAPGVGRRPVADDGLVGTFFTPAGPGPRPGILVVGGSDGGLSEGLAALLASHGFATLALAYFRAAGLPADLVEIPLEYFERALRWLARQAPVAGGALGVVGRSRGGELALLLGATCEQIRIVVGYVPSGLVHAGIAAAAEPGAPPRPAWTHRGAPLPFLPPAGPPLSGPPGTPQELRPVFLRSLEDRAAAERAAIPVERIRGPVLLVSGEDDRLWPSPILAERAVARLAAHGHPHPVTHLRYPDAGHMIGPPGLPATANTIVHPLRGVALALGGTPAGNAAAGARSWPRVLEVLRRSLG